jgi:threonylcarbamoyladenosine tRNA methylthiotransferase MtaB
VKSKNCTAVNRFMDKNKKVLGFTLGCRLNQADTALIFGRLENDGYTIVKPGSGVEPDLVIVNTCTVTSNAARKSRQSARSFRKKFPNACIIVAGCDCEKGIAEWEKESAVDLIIPNAEKKDIAHRVKIWRDNRGFSREGVHLPPLSCSEECTVSGVEFSTAGIDTSFREDAIADYPFKSRAFLKVQEGCNAFCTYCIVPYVRGRERSRSFREVLDEAKAFIDKGHREIVITGVNISTYRDGNICIADLIERLIGLPGDFRLRLSSMEPHPENRPLIDLIASSSKLCRFLHLPLQHGTDAILERMGRNYTTAEFADFMNKASEKIPGVHLGTDIIVGFPGESDDLFRDSSAFISSLPIANAHIFRFSPREGTPAADYSGQIPQITAKHRAVELGLITAEMNKNFAESQKGSNVRVLIEKENSDKSFEGWSDNYIKVNISGEGIVPGEFKDIIL